MADISANAGRIHLRAANNHRFTLIVENHRAWGGQYLPRADERMPIAVHRSVFAVVETLWLAFVIQLAAAWIIFALLPGDGFRWIIAGVPVKGLLS